MKIKKYGKSIVNTIVSSVIMISLSVTSVLAATTYDVAIPHQFGYAKEFSEGLALVGMGDKYGFIDRTGELVIPYRTDNSNGYDKFSDGMFVVKDENNKYGFIDKTGKLVIPYQFRAVGEFSNGLAPVSDESRKWGYIDKTGKLVIPYQFKEAGTFSEGLAAVSDENRKWGYIDKTGKLVIPHKLNYGKEFNEGLAIVQSEDEMYGYINTKGELVIPYSFYDARGFSEGLAAVYLGSWGYVNTKGELVIPYQFETGYDFSDGLIPAKINDRWGYVNTDGEIAIFPEFVVAEEFSEGLAVVRDKSYTMTGLIDTDGRLIVPYKFRFYGKFSEGLIISYDQNNKVGYVSSPFNTYNIQNNNSSANNNESNTTVATPDSSQTTLKSLGYTVNFNDRPLDIKGEVLVIDDVIYYPFRELLESMGASVSWDSATKSATATRGKYTSTFTVGKNSYVVNGRVVSMDDAALVIEKGKIYIPLRYPVEAIGFDLGWESDRMADINAY